MNVRVSPVKGAAQEKSEKFQARKEEEPNRLSVDIMESLILAQDERWRRA